jgi:hypothetical protein
MHPVLVFQDVGGIRAVFPATARHDTVVTAIGAPVVVQELEEFTFPRFPVDQLLLLGIATGIAHAIVVDMHVPGAGPFPGMSELRVRCRTLVRHDASFAENDGFGQVVLGCCGGH